MLKMDLRIIRGIALFVFTGCITVSVMGQVGVNTNHPHSSSALEIISDTSGVLLPRMSQAKRDLIKKPADGLIIYCNDCLPSSGFYAFVVKNRDKGVWQRVGQAISADVTFDHPSDSVVPSQKAVKSYFENAKGLKLMGNNITGNTSNFNSLTELGTHNVALGLSSLNVLDSGRANLAIGNLSLHKLTKGSDNVAVGFNSLNNITTQSFNTAIGSHALRDNQNGNQNVAIGHTAMGFSVGGINSVAIGYQAGRNLNGDLNTVVGQGAGAAAKGGDYSFTTAIGAQSAHNSQTNSSIYLGYRAGYYDTADVNRHNLFVENSESLSPLIGGNFRQNRVGINTHIDSLHLPNSATLQVGGDLSLYKGAAVNEFSVDPLLNDNSNTAVPTEAAVKAYVDKSLDSYLKPNNNWINTNGDAHKGIYINGHGGVGIGTSDVNGLINISKRTHSNTPLVLNVASASAGDSYQGDLSETVIGGSLHIILAGSEHWWSYDFGRDTIVLAYSIQHVNRFGNNPKSWRFEGSHDNANWTVLDSRVNGALSTLLSFQNDIPYRYYRIFVYEHYNSSVNETRLGKITLYGATELSGLKVDNKGLVTIGDAYTLPNKNGTSGQVLKMSSGNNAVWSDKVDSLVLGKASLENNLSLFNGTIPVGSAKDGVHLYSQDVSASAELKVMDEAGNITTLSPHNFSLSPKSHPMAWSFYSENKEIGQRINVDMLKTIRLVEEMSGEKLVYRENLETGENMEEDNEHNESLKELQKQVEILTQKVQQLEKELANSKPTGN